MYEFSRESAWSYSTSSGVSASADIASMAVAGIVLTSPDGNNVTFRYGAVGVGLSVGSLVNISGSTRDFLSAGQIFLADGFSGKELTQQDIEGWCLIAEASAGSGFGGAVGAILLGVTVAWPDMAMKGGIRAPKPETRERTSQMQ